MGKLLLIKHSLPQVGEDMPSRDWVLSPEGRARCVWLGGQLQRQGAGLLFASVEPKARETAFIAGAEAGLMAMTRPDLHENDRTGLGYLAAADFEAAIAAFFAHPDQVRMGEETAHAARARFEGAVRTLAGVAGERTAAIVAHGTVITLLVSAYNDVAPLDLWRALTLPSYVVVDSADFSWDGAVISYSP